MDPDTNEATTTEKPKRKLRVVISRPKLKAGETAEPPYSGIHPSGLKFQDGAAVTDDAILAHGMQEQGFVVLDDVTGEPAWEKVEGKKKK